MNVVRFKDSDRSIRVGKILCLGKNYPEHAKEMHEDIPSHPIVFIKPATAIIDSGNDVVYPPFSHKLHHEVELVVLIGTPGRHIPQADAFAHVAGYGLGLDMTLRDVQAEAKKKGEPWSVAKGFDTSAPVSPFVSKEKVADPHNLDISLKVNGSIRQQSNTRHMIFRIDAIIAYLSSVFTLEEGDLIFTGTPEGIGQVVPGDTIEARLDSVGEIRVGIKEGTTAGGSARNG